MPVTISGDGGISGLGGLDGYDLETQTLVVSGDTTVADQAAGRATLFCDASTNTVGINTTTPASSVFLEVADNTDPIVRINNTAGGNLDIGSSGTFGYVQSSSGHELRLGSNGSNSIVLQGNGDINIDSNTLYVDTSANVVGIGTTSPASLLHIAGATSPGIKIEDNDNGFSPSEITVTNGGRDLNFRYNQDIYFNEEGTTRLTIQDGGNVGIGTTSPSYPLHVVGNIRLAGSDGGSDRRKWLFSETDDGSTSSLGIQSFAGGSWDDKLTIQSDGNIGIGTTDPQQKLDVFSAIRITNGANYTQIGTTSVGDTNFQNNGNNWLTVKNGVPANSLRVAGTGNIGIGTTNPQGLLHVQGPDNNATFFLTGTTGTTVRGFNVSLSQEGSFQNAVATLSAPQADEGTMAFQTGSSERMRIDSDGRLVVGSTTAASIGGTALPRVQVISSNSDARTGVLGLGVTPWVVMGRSRSSTQNSYSALNEGTQLGRVIFAGDDGTDYQSIGADIVARADSDWVTDNTPTRLVFSTTPTGSNSPTERMRVKPDGTINFSNVQTFADNTAAKAGGLVDGDVYRQSDGTLMIVFT